MILLPTRNIAYVIVLHGRSDIAFWVYSRLSLLLPRAVQSAVEATSGGQQGKEQE